MQDIFEGTVDPNKPGEVKEGELDPIATKLQEILNEDGKPKYANIEIALEALKETQQYIPTLKSEKEALQAKLAEVEAKSETREDIEDVVKKLLEPKSAPEDNKSKGEGFTKESVAELVRQETLLMRQEEQLKANRIRVATKLTELFGDANVAQEEIAKKAAELNTTKEAIGTLAQESPDLVLQLFNSGSKNKPTSQNDSTVNSLMFQNKKVEPVGRPEKSLLSGATSNEQRDFMRKIKEEVYAKYDVQEA